MDFLLSFFKLRVRNQWCHCKMSAVISDYTFLSLFYMPWMQVHRLLSFKYIDRSVIILPEATSIIPVTLVIVINFFKGGFFLFFGCTKSVAIEIKAPYRSCWAISSCHVVYYTLKCGSTFWVCQWNLWAGLFEAGLREPRVSGKFELGYESLKSEFSLIHFAYNLMTGYSKKNRESYPSECFSLKEKETWVKI